MKINYMSYLVKGLGITVSSKGLARTIWPMPVALIVPTWGILNGLKGNPQLGQLIKSPQLLKSPFINFLS